MTQQKAKRLKGLSTGLVIAAVVIAFLIAGVRIFGLDVYGVLTGSMEPTYPTGSMIYVKAVDTDDLRVNDVITFSLSTNVIVTHRIVEVVPDESNPSVVRYRTKGDANDEADASLVSASNVIGKVMFVVPKLGYLANYIQQPPGIYVAIAVCGLMIAFVFYTDSLDEKLKQAGHDRHAAVWPQKQSLTDRADDIAIKLTGKPLFSNRQPRQTMGGYAPTPAQPQNYPQQQYAPPQQWPQGYLQGHQYQQGNPPPYTQYPQYPAYPQYKQQPSQGQAGYQQPVQQGYPPVQYPQQGYPQYPQTYQPSAPAPIYDQPQETPVYQRRRRSQR